MKTLTKWTQPEIDMLASKLAKRRLEKPYESFISLVEEVQKETLPPERRRVGLTVTALRTTLLPAFAQAYSRMRSGMDTKPEEPVEHAIVFLERQVPVIDFSKLDPELIVAEAAKLEYRLKRQPTRHPVVEETHTQVQIVITSSGRRFVEEGPKTRKVLVVGLLADQFAAVQEACSKEGWNLELSLLDTSHAASTYRGHAEYVVFSKFTSHGHIEAVRAKHSKNLDEAAARKIFYCDGVTSVTNKCRDINSMQ